MLCGDEIASSYQSDCQARFITGGEDGHVAGRLQSFCECLLSTREVTQFQLGVSNVPLRVSNPLAMLQLRGQGECIRGSIVITLAEQRTISEMRRRAVRGPGDGIMDSSGLLDLLFVDGRRRVKGLR